MKAIELSSVTDNLGNLKIEYKFEKAQKFIRVLLLVNEDENEEQMWMNSISKNPSFNFLAEESEDIYTVVDGVPFNAYNFK